MKSNWICTTLGDICKLQSGAGFPTKYQGRSEGEFPFFKVSDMNLEGNEDQLVRARNYISEEVRSVLTARIFPAGSVLFPKVGGAISTNKKRQAVQLSCVDNNIMGLIPDPEKIDADFLFQWMRGIDLYDFSNKANPPSITQGVVSSWPISLPPLDEQKRIVAKLDQAFAALDRARAHAEANLADADALFDSELRAHFEHAGSGADRLPFDRLCDAITPKTKIKRQDYLEEGCFPIVSQEAEKVSGYWNAPDALLGLNAPVVVFGDHTRCLKYIDFDFVVGADGTKVLKPRNGISAAYLYYGLRSQPIEGGGYARHFKFLREKTLPDIPLEKQDAIAAKLFDTEEKCKELASHYESKLTDIATLRQSLLQQAFSGQL